MIPRVASTGSARNAKTLLDDGSREFEEETRCSKTSSSFVLVLCKFAVRFSRLTVALVLFSCAAVALRGQEPQQWPQDDPYPAQQPAYQQPQYNQPQPYPQQGYGYSQQNQPQGYYQQQPAYPQAQGVNAEQLEQLVAPIALYPDSLLAQVLAASTYPAQISAADQWLRGMGNAPPEQIAAGANAQTNWDPSVKALTAYPQVLTMMDQNLQWTTALGNAYYNQPQDVLQTVQVLRQRAQGAGNLQSTPQEQVQDNQGYIALAPANPEYVYVPAYNPWMVYGQPISPYPYYQPYDAVGAVVGAAIQFGAGFAVHAFFGMPFGFMGWGLDWAANAVLFHHDAWCSHSGTVADWGFARGGPRAWRAGEYANFRDHYGDRYGRAGEYARFGDRPGGGSWNSHGNERGFNRGDGRFPSARPVSGNQNGFNRGYPVGHPGQGMDGRSLGGSSRGYLGSQQFGSYRTPQPVGPQPYRGAFGNRAEMYGNGPLSYANRPQQFSNNGQRPGFGQGFSPRAPESFGGGRGPGFVAPSQPYRAPAPGLGHGGFSRPPSSNSFAGSYGQPSRSSGGFHPFGGGHNGAPSFGGGHSFGGGGSHSFFGGGGGGHSFGGGGHSFGGAGHSSGGGHSGGGRSSGGGRHH
jgi:hypothetical protein